MKWIVFDFDGTLADTAAITLDAYNHVAPQFGLQTLSKQEATSLKGLSTRQVLAKYHIPLWKLPRLVRAVQLVLRQHIDDAMIYPGISQAIQALSQKGYKLAILTSNDDVVLRSFLAKHALTAYFQDVSCGSSLFGKAAVMRKFLHTHHLKPNEVIYVGDETRDIEAAKKAHIPIISVTWGIGAEESLRALAPAYLIHSPDELLQLVS